MDGDCPRSLPLPLSGRAGSGPWSPDTQCSLHHNWWPPGRGRLAGPCPQPGLLFGCCSGPRQGSASDWPWPVPPSSVSSALCLPHLCTYRPLHACLSPLLDCHLIFLFPQPPDTEFRTVYAQEHLVRSEDTWPPSAKEAGVLPAPPPRCEAAVSLDLAVCCEMLER